MEPAHVPRSRQRVCLEAGLKLDLNELMRKGCVVPGAYSAFRMRWINNYTGEDQQTLVGPLASLWQYELPYGSNPRYKRDNVLRCSMTFRNNPQQRPLIPVQISFAAT